MAELTRGNVGDRPWGRTLAALGQRAVTGQVNVASDGKLYQIAFSQGAVAGALSPLASDSAARVALTLHLCSSTQVAELSRRATANPQRDEIEIIAEYVRIAPDHAMRLRRRVIAIRAARTFAIEHGDFVVDDQISMPLVPGSEIDVRGIIYMGAAQHLTEARLASELARLGGAFQLRPDAIPELPQFGFGDAERPILNALVNGSTVEALEQAGYDPRAVRAVVYALATSGAATAEAPPPQPPARPAPVASRIVSRAPAPAPAPAPASTTAAPTTRFTTGPTSARAPAAVTTTLPPAPVAAPGPRFGGQRPPAATPMPDTFTTARSAARQSAESIEMPTLRRELLDLEPMTTRKAVAPAPATPPRRPAQSSAATAQIQALIASRLQLVDGNADHFVLLGVSQISSDDQIRKAYFALARQLHPDRLASLGMTDDAKNGQRLFAQVNTAFGVLSDPSRKAEYLDIMKRGGEIAIRAEQAKADAILSKTLDAEEAFHRAEKALKRDAIPQAIADLKKAVELEPNELEYQTLLAWALFCGASDKVSDGPVARGKFAKLITKNPQAVAPRFYLARMERMLGRDPEALKVFESILRIDPEHADSIAEIRVLRQRLKK